MIEFYRVFSSFFLLVSFLLVPLRAQTSQNTTLIGRCAYGPCYSVAVEETYAYFGNGGYLMIADVSDPENPVEVGKIILPGVCRGIAVNGNYAYALGR